MSESIKDFLSTIGSAATMRAYRADLEGWQRNVAGSILSDITLDDVRQAIRDQAFSSLKSSTRRRKISVLRQYLSWMHQNGAAVNLSSSDLSTIEATPDDIESEQIKALTLEECRRLLYVAKSTASFDSVRNHAIIFTLLTIPIRRAAFSRLNTDDLSLDEAIPFLDSPTIRGGLGLRYTIPNETAEVIRSHISYYGIGTGPLWRSHSRRNPGGRLTPTSIYRIVRDTAVAAGLPEIGAHTSRHTGCTLAIDNGASLQQVQTHARHKPIETTMVYVHQRDRPRDSAADFIKLDEADRS